MSFVADPDIGKCLYLLTTVSFTPTVHTGHGLCGLLVSLQRILGVTLGMLEIPQDATRHGYLCPAFLRQPPRSLFMVSKTAAIRVLA